LGWGTKDPSTNPVWVIDKYQYEYPSTPDLDGLLRIFPQPTINTNQTNWQNLGFFMDPDNGYVGIADATPDERLTVNGNIKASGTICDGSNNCIGSGGSGSLWTPSGSNVYYNSGNVGIGDSTPSAKLEISSPGTFGSKEEVLALKSSTSNRPAIKFLENDTYGMSIEYNGSGFGTNNKIVINSNTGNPVLTITNGGDFSVSGSKNFVQDYPTDPSKQIVYTALEGGEVGTYTRGSGQLINGEVKINLPEHFSLVTGEQGVTVQVTPTSETAGLYVASKGTKYIVIKEVNNGQGNATFDYLVQGVRKGYENRPAVVDKDPVVAPDAEELLAEGLTKDNQQGQPEEEVIVAGDQQQPETASPAVGQPELKWYQKLGNFFKNLFK